MGMSALMSAIGTSNESEDEAEEKPKKQDRFARLEEAYRDQFTMIGVTVAAFHEADGMVIIGRADPLSKRLVGVARQNPAVYKALKKYIDASAYTMLAEEIGVIALAIAANHGLNPVGWLIDKVKGKGNGDAELQSVA